MLLHRWHIQHSKMKRVFACSKYEELAEVFQGIAASASGYSLSEIEPKLLLKELLVESSILKNMASQDVSKTKASRAVVGVRLLVTDAASLILDPDDETEASYYLRNLNATQLESDFLFEAGELGSSQKGILALREELSGWSEPSVALEVFFGASRTVVPDSPFTEVWSEIMRSPVIPFDPDKRHKSFRTAHESLRDYLDLWADPPEGTWRRNLLDR